MIKMVVSGGQTGVDRAALDAAIELGIPHEGWCPNGRRAELGTTIPDFYNLRETESPEFSERTKLNIRDSDGTLVLVPSLPIHVTDGTILTIQELKESKKPYLLVNLSSPITSEELLSWVDSEGIEKLNVAGPRESQSPGIYKSTLKYLSVVFKDIYSSCSDIEAVVSESSSAPNLGYT